MDQTQSHAPDLYLIVKGGENDKTEECEINTGSGEKWE
jgi:hypothetical protein